MLAVKLRGENLNAGTAALLDTAADAHLRPPSLALTEAAKGVGRRARNPKGRKELRCRSRGLRGRPVGPTFSAPKPTRESR